jgi:UDP-GlcNAc:undecaprenyl-phosphate/decaprenyl-phosphate GlcNAc-1-phosphate transferase
MMDNELLWAGLKAVLIAVVLTPIVRDIFRSYNIVDRPGQRKVHAHPIPRIGGIPVAIAFVIAVASQKGVVSLGIVDGQLKVPALLPGALIIFLTGFLDDFFDLRPMVKLAGQMAAGISVFMLGIRIESVAGHPLGIVLSLLATVFWLVVTTNALNLIDGLDGLCAGVGLVATLAMAGAAFLEGNYELLQVIVPLSGALLGFLCYNSNPATVFLGDSGALLIGFLLGCYGMEWTQKTATLVSLAVPLMALSIPLLDVTLSVVRRSIKNKPIFGADRGHIHHRLLDRGLTPRRAVLILYLGSAAAAGFSILLSSPKAKGFELWLILAALGTMYLGVRQLRYTEFESVAGALRGVLRSLGIGKAERGGPVR